MKKYESWNDERRPAEVVPKVCFCIGPQNGEPLCPCMMRAKAEERRIMREEILKEIGVKK